MKVPFFDKRIQHQFYAVLSAISVVTSIVFLLVDIDNKWKSALGLVILTVIFMVLYLILWCRANSRQSILLRINSSEVEVKFGNIFSEQAALKVIAFNEYFDTQVDDNGTVIAKSTLNGQFIERFYKDKVADLDTIISADAHLSGVIVEENENRRFGKKTKYKLGTICIANDYLLMALTHFNDDNKAYLEITDYINCLMNFWNEIDRIYAGRAVALPVFGSGMTRINNYDFSDQELLEIIVWTFKVSRIKFTYPSRVKIVVFQEKRQKINLVALKDLET